MAMSRRPNPGFVGRMTSWHITSLSIVLLLVILITWLRHSVSSKGPTSDSELNNLGRDRHILLYTNISTASNWNLGPESAIFNELNCPTSTCSIHSNRMRYHTADAVIFHGSALRKVNIPSTRPDGQIWIFFSRDTPISMTKPQEVWRNAFNWSMTYHEGSDIYFPYGRVHQRILSPPINYTSIAKQERKPVVWFVSTCETQSRRGEYVEELQKYIPVDIYGECGNLVCEAKDSMKCLKEINDNYKFILSFENALCEGFITEQFYEYVSMDVVPVVRGGADYKSLVPGVKQIAVHTDDFASPEALAKHLIYLSKNPLEYAKYLEWKNRFALVTTRFRDLVWCNLCTMLHDIDGHRTQIDPYQFWFENHHCRDPSDIK